MYNYLSTMIGQFGISSWMLCVMAIIFVWAYTWKLLALWKAAREKSVVWFIALALINTVGILEILYIFVFSKMEYGKTRSTSARKRKKR